MATLLSITIADTLYWELEAMRDKNIGRSEFVEGLIRAGINSKNKKKGDNNDEHEQ